MPETPDIKMLLDRMRNGDRDAAGTFVRRYEGRIRRRIRWKLGHAVRRVFDSQEIVSTVGRRLDAFVRRGRLTAASEGELWSLVYRMADAAVVDKARTLGKSSSHGDAATLDTVPDPGPGPGSRAARGAGPAIDLNRVRRLLNDRTDEQILDYWLKDTPHFKIAGLVGLSPSAVRQRWQRIKVVLRSSLPNPEAWG